MDEYCVVKCPTSKSGHDHIMTHGTNIDAEDQKCAVCGETNEIIPYDKITDPDDILTIVESELESANHHSIGDLPSKIFSNVKSLVPKKNHTKLARSIGNCFGNL